VSRRRVKTGDHLRTEGRESASVLEAREAGPQEIYQMIDRSEPGSSTTTNRKFG